MMTTTVMEDAKTLSLDIKAASSHEEVLNVVRATKGNKPLYISLYLAFNKEIEFPPFDINETDLRLRLSAENEGWFKYFLNNKKYALLLVANTYVGFEAKKRFYKNALEQMHDTDAHLLMKVVAKKWIDDVVTYELLSEVFPTDFPPQPTEINITQEEIDKETEKLRKKLESKDKSQQIKRRRPRRSKVALDGKQVADVVNEANRQAATNNNGQVKRKRGRPPKKAN